MSKGNNLIWNRQVCCPSLRGCLVQPSQPEQCPGMPTLLFANPGALACAYKSPGLPTASPWSGVQGIGMSWQHHKAVQCRDRGGQAAGSAVPDPGVGCGPKDGVEKAHQRPGSGRAEVPLVFPAHQNICCEGFSSKLCIRATPISPLPFPVLSKSTCLERADPALTKYCLPCCQVAGHEHSHMKFQISDFYSE